MRHPPNTTSPISAPPSGICRRATGFWSAGLLQDDPPRETMIWLDVSAASTTGKDDNTNLAQFDFKT
jgi:hypothetical protein